MSRDQVVQVEHQNVFLPRTRWHELAADHVRLDEIESRDAWEARALRSILQGAPVSVTGPPGVGKSSLIAFVCSQLPDTHVAFRLPVTGADDPTSVSVMASMALGAALHAIDFEDYQRSALEAARASAISTEQTRPRLSTGKLGGGPLPAEINVELGSLRQEHGTNRLASDRLAGLDRLIDILVYHGKSTVFICEDTEALVGGTDQADVIERFFTGPIRAFLTEVDAPLVIAVQAEIALGSQTFQDLRSRTTDIDVPGFSDPHNALTRIATRRIADSGSHFAVGEVVHADAFEALAGFYVEAGASLRYALAVLHGAAAHAADMGAEIIRAAHVQHASAEWRAQRR
jgi:AAA ATPase-like protein